MKFITLTMKEYPCLEVQIMLDKIVMRSAWDSGKATHLWLTGPHEITVREPLDVVILKIKEASTPLIKKREPKEPENAT